MAKKLKEQIERNKPLITTPQKKPLLPPVQKPLLPNPLPPNKKLINGWSMALINCPECGHQMSDTAKKCPNCGYSKSMPNSKIWLLILLWLCGVGSLIMMFFFLSNWGTPFMPIEIDSETTYVGILCLIIAIALIYAAGKIHNNYNKNALKYSSFTGI